jgi:hypothetical protein
MPVGQGLDKGNHSRQPAVYQVRSGVLDWEGRIYALAARGGCGHGGVRYGCGGGQQRGVGLGATGGWAEREGEYGGVQHAGLRGDLVHVDWGLHGGLPGVGEGRRGGRPDEAQR